jgi:hypothetical protein
LGLQWQWQANPQPAWAIPDMQNSVLRLYSYQLPDSAKNYWDAPNILLQKFPAEEFTATTKFSFQPRVEGERFGFIVLGSSYADLSVTKKSDGNYLSYTVCKDADKGHADSEQVISRLTDSIIFFRVKVNKGASCIFSYSTDGLVYKEMPDPFIAQPGKWIGAKIGYFCSRTTKTNDAGFVAIDWFRVEGKY